MKSFLLDSHVWLWANNSPSRLSTAAQELINDSGTSLLLSLASVWEMAIKVSLGKLIISQSENIDDYVARINSLMGVTLAPITTRDVQAITTLPWIHKDPFDRMLIAQAITLNLPIITADPHFKGYGVEVVW